ncbi:MAG: hypothetical protein DWQ08_13500 [Proteobacteria bacterium]|nr:MAG: hypothetical protein DWQ08_13500 [Pseudomonadota bacterium]
MSPDTGSRADAFGIRGFDFRRRVVRIQLIGSPKFICRGSLCRKKRLYINILIGINTIFPPRVGHRFRSRHTELAYVLLYYFMQRNCTTGTGVTCGRGTDVSCVKRERECTRGVIEARAFQPEMKLKYRSLS